MNTQGGNIWVFNIIKNPGKINLKQLLKLLLFFFKKEKHSEVVKWEDLVATLWVFIWENIFQ